MALTPKELDMLVESRNLLPRSYLVVSNSLETNVSLKRSMLEERELNTTPGLTPRHQWNPEILDEE